MILLLVFYLYLNILLIQYFTKLISKRLFTIFVIFENSHGYKCVFLHFSHDAHDFCVPALMSSAFDQGESIENLYFVRMD